MYDDDEDDYLGKDPDFIKKVQEKSAQKPEIENTVSVKSDTTNVEVQKEIENNLDKGYDGNDDLIKDSDSKEKVQEKSAQKPEIENTVFAKTDTTNVEPQKEIENTMYDDDEDNDLGKSSDFIKIIQKKSANEPKLDKEIGEISYSTNIPSRDGDEDAIDERKIDIKVIRSGKSVEYDIQKAREKQLKEDQIRYDYILRNAKNLTGLSKVIWGIFIFAGSVLGIFLLANIVDFVESLASITPVLRYFFIGLMLVFSAIILGLLIKIALSLRRFSTACDIDLSTIKSLSERDEYTKSANKDYLKIQTYLQNNLISYQTSYLENLNLADDDIKTIKRFRNEMTELDSASISTKDWIEKYRTLFEAKLTEVAKKRISQYSRQVGYSTAISPFPLIDRLIVLSATLAMIKDVFAIYNLKLGKMDSIKLFAMSISNVYFSGMTQEGTTSLATNLFDSDFISQMGLNTVTTSVGKFMLPKLSEGSINAFLVWRLGKFILKRLNLK